MSIRHDPLSKGYERFRRNPFIFIFLSILIVFIMASLTRTGYYIPRYFNVNLFVFC